MTLTEIEETLNTLKERHSGLNEAMLIMLLRAGGWEDKQVEEAKEIFRSHGNISREEIKKIINLPEVQDIPVFIPPVEVDHLLDAPQQHVDGKFTVSEPQSLVTHTTVTQVVTKETKKEELPHNLPLRPFETSEHVWPFSRYRDVFYGDPYENNKEGTKTETTKIETNYVISPISSPMSPASKRIVEEKITERSAEKAADVPGIFIPHPVAKEAKTTGDEKVVVLACSMLLVILLLLGYMYSNGRL